MQGQQSKKNSEDRYWAEEMLAQLEKGHPALQVLEVALQGARACGHLYGSENSAKATGNLQAEVEELKHAVEVEKTAIRVRNEMGDVLLSLLDICLQQGISFQEVTQSLAYRWLGRKAFMEKSLRADKLDWRTSSSELCSALWQQAKKELKAKEEAN